MKRVIGVVLLILMMLSGEVYGKEESRTDVVISFNLQQEYRYPYQVRVSEGGSLYDGSQRITNGIMEYQLSVGENKEFRLQPDKGYEVKEIKINDKEMERGIEQIVIEGVSSSSVLEVRYGRIEESSEKWRLLVDTGDGIKLGVYISVMVMMLYEIYRKERENKEEEGNEE